MLNSGRMNMLVFPKYDYFFCVKYFILHKGVFALILSYWIIWNVFFGEEWDFFFGTAISISA